MTFVISKEKGFIYDNKIFLFEKLLFYFFLLFPISFILGNAATNINIPQAIKNGKFREDLYYRLNTVSIFIPSLRERKEDISLLFRKFASDFAEQYNTPSIRLDKKAMDIITKYNWPGNIRQLKNKEENKTLIISIYYG